MRKVLLYLLAAQIFATILCAAPALAHFGMVIPSQPMVLAKKDAKITFDIAFAHPFSGAGMDMKKPVQFIASVNGQSVDLANDLVASTFMKHKAWKTGFEIARPGVYQFAVVPQPYFEPAEDCFIIHYAKTYVAAYGNEDGWETPLGLPVEIVPLTRPFGNYAGNVFQGRVLLNGKPLPGADVEVECLNENGRHVAPNPYFETQNVKADENGVFTFAAPWAGWWGFAALAESPSRLPLDGKERAVELGGILWLQFTAPELAKQAR